MFRTEASLVPRIFSNMRQTRPREFASAVLVRLATSLRRPSAVKLTSRMSARAFDFELLRISAKQFRVLGQGHVWDSALSNQDKGAGPHRGPTQR